ncbi:membrane protein [Bacteroidales bacterium]|nr:membrane protein [Bacteroidales bacterium]
MEKKYAIYALLSCLLLSLGIKTNAQYDAQLSNYWAALSYYNPAYVGQSGNLELMGLNRQQWVGIEGAPKSLIITGDMPIKFLGRTHGVGASMFSENIGLFTHSIISGQYAYQKKLWKGNLSLGIKLGMIKESFRGTGVNLGEEVENNEGEGETIGTDEGMPNTDLDGSGIDLGIGIYYTRGKWYAGFSSQHLNQASVEIGDKHNFDLTRSYYLVGGYNMILNNPLLELQPSAFMKQAAGTMQAELSLRMIYNKLFWGGLSYRYKDSGILMLGGQYKSICAGYAYDFPMSDIGKESFGSHELFVKYVMEIDLDKRKKSKHKSIRML